MKGNIMDKKILLSGAAALVLGASLYAAPASASALSLTIEGEGAVTALMNDNCTAGTANLGDNTDITLAALQTAYGFAAINLDASGVLTDDTASRATGCGANSEDNPVWGVETSWEWSASGTLANGLGVTIKEGNEVELDGAFGTLTFADGVDSGVKAAMVNGDGDIDVTGNNIGGHTQGTSGTAGVGFLWQAPSVGGVDLFVSYSPNADNSGLTGASFEDTIGFGASFATDMLTVSAGFESATGAACAVPAALASGADLDTATGLGADPDGAVLKVKADTLLGGSACGDEQLVALGMEMSAGEFTINAGYSELDSDGADTTVMNIGLSTSLGAYDLAIDYVDSQLDYQYLDVTDDQSVIGVELSTALGDGVDLILNFSTNDYDVAGTGSDNNYRAEAKLDIAF
jgi:hypothetical protein